MVDDTKAVDDTPAKPAPAPKPAPKVTKKADPAEPAQSFAASTKQVGAAGPQSGPSTATVPQVELPEQPAPKQEPSSAPEPNDSFKASIAKEQEVGAVAVKTNLSRRDDEIALGKKIMADRAKAAKAAKPKAE